MDPLTDAELDALEKLHTRMLRGSVLNDDGSVLLTHPHLTQALTQAFVALPRLLAEVRAWRMREASGVDYLTLEGMRVPPRGKP